MPARPAARIRRKTPRTSNDSASAKNTEAAGSGKPPWNKSNPIAETKVAAPSNWTQNFPPRLSTKNAATKPYPTRSPKQAWRTSKCGKHCRRNPLLPAAVEDGEQRRTNSAQQETACRADCDNTPPFARPPGRFYGFLHVARELRLAEAVFQVILQTESKILKIRIPCAVFFE